MYFYLTSAPWNSWDDISYLLSNTRRNEIHEGIHNVVFVDMPLHLNIAFLIHHLKIIRSIALCKYERVCLCDYIHFLALTNCDIITSVWYSIAASHLLFSLNADIWHQNYNIRMCTWRYMDIFDVYFGRFTLLRFFQESLKGGWAWHIS